MDKTDALARKGLISQLREAAWESLPPEEAIKAIELETSTDFERLITWPIDPRHIDKVLWHAARTELAVVAMTGRIPPGAPTEEELMKNESLGPIVSGDVINRTVEHLNPAQRLRLLQLLVHVVNNMHDPLRVALGEAPVICLTEAQQMALWFSEPPEHITPHPAFVDGLFVMFSSPIRFVTDAEGRALLTELEDELPEFDDDEDADLDLLGVLYHGPGADTCTLLTRSTLHNRPALVTNISLTTLDDSGDGTMSATARAAKMLLSTMAVAYSFGLETETPVDLVPDRAERRRRDRAIAKRERTPSQVTVRYLRDRAGSIKMRSERKTGRTVAPHLRIGHFRDMRTGSMSLPKEQRPTVHVYIPPCIVNGHLGTPKEMVVYMERRSRSSGISVLPENHSSIIS